MPQPVISLRPFSNRDRPFFNRLATDERVTRFIGDGKPWDVQNISSRVNMALQATPLNREGAARWFLAHDDQQGVGLLVATRRDAGVEIGYWVSPDHWGRGIAGSMVDKAKTIIPELFDCHRLLAQVTPRNVASARVLTRRGFQLTPRDGNHDLYSWSAASS